MTFNTWSAGLLAVELRGSQGPPKSDSFPEQAGQASSEGAAAATWGCYPSLDHVADLLKDLDHRGGWHGFRYQVWKRRGLC